MYSKLKNDSIFEEMNVSTVLYDTEAISSLRAQVLNLLPKNLKCSKSFSEFKKNIRKWTTKECPCHLCKVYVENLGFM